MEFLQHHLFEQGLLSLREVARLLLFSGLFTTVCVIAFPRNAPSRRILLLTATSVLLILPWVSTSVGVLWFVPIEELPPVTLSAAVPNIVLWGWLGIAVVLVLLHLFKTKAEITSLARLPNLDVPRAKTEIAELSGAMSMPTPRLKLGDCACATTLTTPTVVLPGNWQNWDANTLRSVLAHELKHIQRRDDRWLLTIRLLVLIYWWMPWLIWLYRVYVRTMEESCDDSASELIDPQLNYVSGLADAAGIEAIKPVIRYSDVVSMTAHHLVGRIGRFAARRDLELDVPAVYWLVISILVLVACITSVEPVAKTPLFPAAQNLAGLPAFKPVDDQTAIFSVVVERTRLPEHISAAAQHRLWHPEHLRNAIYPGAAIREGIEAEVIVEFNVNADGSVTNVLATSETVISAFCASAIRAVKQTRYSPDHSIPTHADPALAIRRTRRGLNDHFQPLVGPVRMRRYFFFRLDRR